MSVVSFDDECLTPSGSFGQPHDDGSMSGLDLEVTTIDDIQCLTDIASLADATLLQLLQRTEDEEVLLEMGESPILKSDRNYLISEVERLWMSRGETSVKSNAILGLTRSLDNFSFFHLFSDSSHAECFHTLSSYLLWWSKKEKLWIWQRV